MVFLFKTEDNYILQASKESPPHYLKKFSSSLASCATTLYGYYK